MNLTKVADKAELTGKIWRGAANYCAIFTVTTAGHAQTAMDSALQQEITERS